VSRVLRRARHITDQRRALHDASVGDGVGKQSPAVRSEFTVIETQCRYALIEHQTGTQLHTTAVFEPTDTDT